jgi:hypothetical protein
MGSLIPAETASTVERGDRGTVVWAVQRALNERGVDAVPLAEDGVYGERTLKAVKAFQTKVEITSDGRFGPQTSERLIVFLIIKAGMAVPAGLIRGVVAGESGYLIGAVNHSVAGGVDCSYLQRRVYEADYSNLEAVHRAFDPTYQVKLLGRALIDRHGAFYGRPGAQTHEAAWRLAALNHNYPIAADKISRVGIGGLSSYWTTPASWVEAIGAVFPDGARVTTPLEWCQRYALGSSAHSEPGLVTRFVTNW